MSYYKLRKISEINPKSDSKVSIVGEVVEIGENSFTIEDRKSKAEIISDSKVKNGKIVRVFCSIVNDKLKADIVQELNNFDLDLFNKVEELYRKAGV